MKILKNWHCEWIIIINLYSFSMPYIAVTILKLLVKKFIKKCVQLIWLVFFTFTLDHLVLMSIFTERNNPLINAIQYILEGFKISFSPGSCPNFIQNSPINGLRSLTRFQAIFLTWKARISELKMKIILI